MAACSKAATVKFTVRRRPAVLVAPASPTPRELKRLSDDQDSLRLHIATIYFYERKESMMMAMGGKGKDPAVVIRDAVAKALVPYYPFGLVKEAKAKVDMEYMRSEAELVVLRRGRVPRVPAGFYALSDMIKARFGDLDFGWGKPVYGGPAEAVSTPALPWSSSFMLLFKNAYGEDGAAVPVYLPRPAMDRLVDEMGKLRRQRSPAVVVATLQQPRHGFPAVVKRSLSELSMSNNAWSL